MVEQNRSQAERKPRVLVVGVGSIGERHLRCTLGTGRALVGVCEPNDSLRQAVASRYPVTGAFRSFEEALRDRWDAAVVATPAHLHVPISLTLAERGIHLLIEKPLSVSTEGIRELSSAIGASGVRAGIAYVHRAHPALSAMRDAIRGGRFGRVLHAASISGQNFPAARPAYREIYFADRRRGGGAIQDALTHSINAVEWLAGPIDRVVTDADHLALAGVEVEDTVHLLARHGQVMSAFVLNQYQMPNEFRITVTCEGGTLRYEPLRNRWRWMDSPGDQWHDESIGSFGRDAWFTVQANRFLDMVEGNGEALCSLEEGVQTLRVGLAALRSAESGCAMVRTSEVRL